MRMYAECKIRVMLESRVWPLIQLNVSNASQRTKAPEGVALMEFERLTCP